MWRSTRRHPAAPEMREGEAVCSHFLARGRVPTVKADKYELNNANSDGLCKETLQNRFCHRFFNDFSLPTDAQISLGGLSLNNPNDTDLHGGLKLLP